MNLNAVKEFSKTRIAIYNELKNGDILDQLENEKTVDQNMSDQQYDSYQVPFLEDESAYGRPMYVEDMLQHFEKDMEERIATEVEDHRNRLFGILSDFRGTLGCAFEQNVPEASSLSPINAENSINLTGQTFDMYPIEDESFQNASFSSDRTIENGYNENSQADIEFSIDKQLLAIVSNCFKISRRLQSLCLSD